MRWGGKQLLDAAMVFGLTEEQARFVLEHEQADGALPERAFDLDDVSRFVLAIMSDGQTAEIDALSFTALDVLSQDEALVREAQRFFAEGAEGASLCSSISEILSRCLDGEPLVRVENWPVMMRPDRVGVVNTADGGCGWLALSVWHGDLGTSGAIQAIAYFGATLEAGLVAERSLSAETLQAFARRLDQGCLSPEAAKTAATVH